MGDWHELKRREAEREALEAESRRRWNIEDQRRLQRDLVEYEFDDELLEEAKRRAAQSDR